MKRLVVPILIAVLAFVSLMLLDKSCRSDAALVKAQAAAAEHARLDKANDAVRAEFEARQNAVMAEKDRQLAQKDVVITQYVEKTSTLTAEITRLKANEPPTTPEIEAMPIVVNLRAQVATLTVAFSLSQKTVTLQAEEIVLLKGKFDALQAISDARGAAIVIKDQRIASLEGLCGVYERRVKQDKFWTFVGKYAPPVTFVVGLFVGK